MLTPMMEIVLSAAAAALAIEVLDDSVEQDSDCDDFVVEMMELGAILWARDEPKARIRGYVEFRCSPHVSRQRLPETLLNDSVGF